MKKYKQTKKRYFLIMEVLIAFALIVFAVLPLVYPHLFIAQEQRRFIHKLDLDIAVNQFYGEILQRLYRNEISWSDIAQTTIFPIDQEFLMRAGYTKMLPYKGSYQFRMIKEKGNMQYALVRLGLRMVFEPSIGDKSKPLIYDYEIFASRLNPAAAGGAPPP